MQLATGGPIYLARTRSSGPMQLAGDTSLMTTGTQSSRLLLAWALGRARVSRRQRWRGWYLRFIMQRIFLGSVDVLALSSLIPRRVGARSVAATATGTRRGRLAGVSGESVHRLTPQ